MGPSSVYYVDRIEDSREVIMAYREECREHFYFLTVSTILHLGPESLRLNDHDHVLL